MLGLCYTKLFSHFQNNKQYFAAGNCSDFSDRVFTVNQTCTEEKYVAIYNETICSSSGKVFDDFTDRENCKNLSTFVREKNSTDYWDPHNCRESCSDPGYACLACTNPDYFTCTRNNSKVCIHPELVCNKYRDCDNGVDEDPEMCGTSDANTILSSKFGFILSLSIVVKLGVSAQLF